jgi:hypothetical protein
MRKQAEALGFRLASTDGANACFGRRQDPAVSKCELGGAEIAAWIHAPTIRQDTASVWARYSRRNGARERAYMRFEFVRRLDQWELSEAVEEMSEVPMFFQVGPPPSTADHPLAPGAVDSAEGRVRLTLALKPDGGMGTYIRLGTGHEGPTAFLDGWTADAQELSKAVFALLDAMQNQGAGAPLAEGKLIDVWRTPNPPIYPWAEAVLALVWAAPFRDFEPFGRLRAAEIWVDPPRPAARR